MAVSTENFRSALHGFNRTDVVQFIQKTTTEHERELRRMDEDKGRLQAELEELRQEMEMLRSKNVELVEEVKSLQSSAAAPQEPAGEDAPMLCPEAVMQTAPVRFDEMELAAYRRAELTERMARERAAASAQRMKATFAQLNEKLRLAEQDVAGVVDALQADFDRLQTALSAAQGIFETSDSDLKAAAELCDAL